jgi:hypothetical protein
MTLASDLGFEAEDQVERLEWLVESTVASGTGRHMRRSGAQATRRAGLMGGVRRLLGR